MSLRLALKPPYRSLLRTSLVTTLIFYSRLSSTPRGFKRDDGTVHNIAGGVRKPIEFPHGNSNPSKLFSELDVLGPVPTPASSINTIYDDGFLLENGVNIRGGDGVVLVNNEVFRWQPAEKGSEEEKKAKAGVLELDEEVWGLLDVVHPKPDLLIIGTGARTLLLSPKTRRRIGELGIRIDAMDTRNAAAQYNLLSVERTGGQVAAALMVESFGK